ncbi:MAG: hypothetical protein K0R09_465 [Clostridiales bacterium]|nr:hypothetical protein [Clostridiales bacterium]
MTVGSKVKQTLANLKGIESTIRTYSIQSHNKDEKKAFEEALQITQGVVKELEQRIKTLEYQEPQYKGF